MRFNAILALVIGAMVTMVVATSAVPDPVTTTFTTVTQTNDKRDPQGTITIGGDPPSPGPGYVPYDCDFWTGITGAGREYCVFVCTIDLGRRNCEGSRCLARYGASQPGQCYCTC